MSNIRRILLEADAQADYSSPELMAQTRAIDMLALENIIERLVRRAHIFEHAFEEMRAGDHTHPMQAFLHASECVSCNPIRLSDTEFYALLTVWCQVCEKVQRPEEQIADDHMVRRFVRGE